MSLLNKIKIKPLAIAMIIVPMIIASVYYAFFASSRYVSSAQVVVRQAENSSQANIPGLALLMSSVDPVSREETLYLSEYIISHDMLQVLQQKVDWSQHFAGRFNDPLYWLSPQAPSEDIVDFYQRLVTARYDETTGLLNVEVQALQPDFAEQVLEIILAQSEQFVNDISKGIAQDQLAFAQAELAEATQRYEKSKEAMMQFQSSSNLLNAQAAAEARAQIIADLESTISKENAKLKNLLSSLADGTPQVRAQRARIRALEQQLLVENKRLVSEASGDKLNVIAAQYRMLEIDVGIAEEIYKTSVTVVENAKLEASKNIRSLIRVVQPNMPEEPIYPRRLYNLITILIALCLLYGITRFVLASIEDHRE